MSIWELLGRREPAALAGETDTVREIVRRLDALPPERARYLAAFAYILARVAHADLAISDREIQRMRRILVERGRLPEPQAALAVDIARAQTHAAGGTEDFLVTREFRQLATPEQCRELLDCLFEVSAADDAISGVEENVIRQVASELGLSRADLATARAAWREHREVLRGGGRTPPP
jgi:uncharacterized tellurite resistance protein B-like protein